MTRRLARIPVTMALPSCVARVEVLFNHEELTAALYDHVTVAELAESDDATVAGLALKALMSAGEVAFEERAEELTFEAWSEVLTASDVAHWDRCAARVETVFFGATPVPDDQGDADDERIAFVTLHGDVHEPYSWADYEAGVRRHFESLAADVPYPDDVPGRPDTGWPNGDEGDGRG